MKVEVVPYQAQWQEKYREEAEQIQSLLGDLLIEIHHIGSTSVPGLCAKPIIDIMPVVRDIKKVDAFNDTWEALGYECMGEFGILGRRYFRKGTKIRTHQVHVFGQESEADLIRHLAFRNYLREHDDEARRYGALKQKLAQRFPNDIEAYCDGKDLFVKEMEYLALNWYWKI